MGGSWTERGVTEGTGHLHIDATNVVSAVVRQQIPATAVGVARALLTPSPLHPPPSLGSGSSCFLFALCARVKAMRVCDQVARAGER